MAAVAALVVASLVSGCVGVTDREDFDAIVDARGGGLSSDLVTDAVAAVGARVGTHDPELTAITITPGSRVVVMSVRGPVRRDELDRYVYRARGGLGDPDPQQLGADDDLDAMSFRVSEVAAFERTEEMADAAFAALGFEGPHVESIVASVVAGEVRVQMSIESDRARGWARFDSEGELVEAARS